MENRIMYASLICLFELNCWEYILPMICEFTNKVNMKQSVYANSF